MARAIRLYQILLNRGALGGWTVWLPSLNNFRLELPTRATTLSQAWEVVASLIASEIRSFAAHHTLPEQDSVPDRSAGFAVGCVVVFGEDDQIENVLLCAEQARDDLEAFLAARAWLDRISSEGPDGISPIVAAARSSLLARLSTSLEDTLTSPLDLATFPVG